MASQMIMTQAELDRLAAVIGEVETTTSGELRLMIVGQSAVFGHVLPLLWSLLLVVGLLGIGVSGHFDDWMMDLWWSWPLLLLVTTLTAMALNRRPSVRRSLTSHHDLHHQVWARAEVEFHRQGLSGTRAHTGVLLFLSLLERQAVVLGDQAIVAKATPHTWDKVLQLMVNSGRQGKWAQGLELALRECGRILAEHFPAQPGKINELPDTVIVKL